MSGSEGAQTSAWEGKGAAKGKWEEERDEKTRIGKEIEDVMELKTTRPKSRTTCMGVPGPSYSCMGVLLSLRTPQSGLDSPSHSLSAALLGHPATELCGTSINPAIVGIP